MTAKINEWASVVGTEQFYLKVGQQLLTRSATFGLTPDGARVPAWRTKGGQSYYIRPMPRHQHDDLYHALLTSRGRQDPRSDMAAKLLQASNRPNMRQLLAPKIKAALRAGQLDDMPGAATIVQATAAEIERWAQSSETYTAYIQTQLAAKGHVLPWLRENILTLPSTGTLAVMADLYNLQIEVYRPGRAHTLSLAQTYKPQSTSFSFQRPETVRLILRSTPSHHRPHIDRLEERLEQVEAASVINESLHEYDHKDDTTITLPMGTAIGFMGHLTELQQLTASTYTYLVDEQGLSPEEAMAEVDKIKEDIKKPEVQHELQEVHDKALAVHETLEQIKQLQQQQHPLRKVTQAPIVESQGKTVAKQTPATVTTKATTQQIAEDKLTREIKRVAFAQAFGPNQQPMVYDQQSALMQKLGRQIHELNTQTQTAQHIPNALQRMIAYHVKTLNTLHEVEDATAAYVHNHESSWLRVLYHMGQAIADVEGLHFTQGVEHTVKTLQTVDDAHQLTKETTALMQDKDDGKPIDAERWQNYKTRLGQFSVKAISTLASLCKKGSNRQHKPANTKSTQNKTAANQHDTATDTNSSSKTPTGQEEKVHKNSLDYKGETHVYQIVKDNVTQKIGESAQGLDKQGQSKRAESQARRLQRETGDDHKTKIIQTFGNKKDARAYETEQIKTARENDPNALPLNKSNH